MQFIIERRKSAKSPWQATKHIIEAASANAALRKFGLKDAYKSDKVKIAAGGKTGRQYRAVDAGSSTAALAVPAKRAPIAAAAVKVDGKRTKRAAKPTVTDSDAPFGYKADGTPRKRPVPTWLLKGDSDNLTVKSEHGKSKRGGARKVHRMTMAERRDMRLADARMQAAADRQQRAGSNKARSLTEQERAALDLLARLDSLKSDVEKMGIAL